MLLVLESKFLTFSKFRTEKIFVVLIFSSWSFMQNMRNFAPYENFPLYGNSIQINSVYLTCILVHTYLQFKVYASTQQSRSSWNAADLKYQGYYNSCDSDWTLVPVLVTTAVLIVALTTIALSKATPKIYQKVALHVKRGNQWYSFFWVASFMKSLCNFAPSV